MYLVEGEQVGKGLAAVLQLQQGCLGTLLLQRALPGLVQGHHAVGMAAPLLQHLLKQRLVPDMQAASTQPYTTINQVHAALAQQGSLDSDHGRHNSKKLRLPSEVSYCYPRIAFAACPILPMLGVQVSKTLPTWMWLGDTVSVQPGMKEVAGMLQAFDVTMCDQL